MTDEVITMLNQVIITAYRTMVGGGGFFKPIGRIRPALISILPHSTNLAQESYCPGRKNSSLIFSEVLGMMQQRHKKTWCQRYLHHLPIAPRSC